MDGALALGDGTIRVFLRLLQMALDHADTLDAGAGLDGQDLEDLALLALLGTGEDDYFVSALDVKFGSHVRGPPERAR